jgi:DNA-binding beta-propeller fold protein YncE
MATTPLRYDVVADWEQLPATYTHLDVVGVDVDSRDRVFVFTRAQPRVIVYAPDGTFLESWSEGFFTERTHGLTIAPDDTVYCVDEGAQVVYHFSPKGELLQTIGTVGVASDTGYDGRTLESIRGGGPFNRPTNVAIGPNGDLYVSDGYGNARVHRFSKAGDLTQSWGAPGTGPGQFNLVHGICIDPENRVLVADRENDRIQLFDLNGVYQGEWTDVQRPTNVCVGPDGLYYVSELWRPVGHKSYSRGVTDVDRPGRVSVLDRTRAVVTRWGGADRCAPGNFVAPHDICVDSRGDLYVAEVTNTFGVRPGLVPAGCHTFQKFARRG